MDFISLEQESGRIILTMLDDLDWSEEAEHQPKWARIVVREMWDVPRAIVIPASGGAFFLNSIFNDTLDEYEDEYTIYWLGDAVDLTGDWNRLPAQAEAVLGCVSTKQVRFDPKRREAIDLVSLGDSISDYTIRVQSVPSLSG